MATIIRMPRTSATMQEGYILRWFKKEGDRVKDGEPLLEYRNDKATMDLCALADGVLLYIAVNKGTVPVDGVVAIIGEEREDVEGLKGM